MNTPPTEAIWEAFHDRLYQFIRAHVADSMTAEDVLQTVFLTVHQRGGDVCDASRLTSWLYQIARHAIADTYRQRAVLALPADADERWVMPAAKTPDIYHHLVPCLLGLLSCLSVADQRAIRQADLGGCAG
jgi:RNA polymerase sigma factor (sigma-70 family)